MNSGSSGLLSDFEQEPVDQALVFVDGGYGLVEVQAGSCGALALRALQRVRGHSSQSRADHRARIGEAVPKCTSATRHMLREGEQSHPLITPHATREA